MSDGSESNAQGAASLRRLIAGSGAAFVVYDLELTSWEGALARRWSGPGEFPEVIQIGAVKLATADFTEIGSLSVLVRPSFNPQLSDYIIGLTGITQAAVEARGVGFAEALQRLAAFIGDSTALSNGGDNDFLAANCRLHDLANPFPPSRLINVATDLRRAVGDDEATSCDLARLVGFVNPGPDHDALADSRAIAIALRHVLERHAV